MRVLLLVLALLAVLSVWSQLPQDSVSSHPAENLGPSLLQREALLQEQESRLNQIDADQKQLQSRAESNAKLSQSLEHKIASQKVLMSQRMQVMYRKSFDQGDLIQSLLNHGVWHGWIYAQKMLAADLEVLRNYREVLAQKLHLQKEQAQNILQLQKEAAEMQNVQASLRRENDLQSQGMKVLATQSDTVSKNLWRSLKRNQNLKEWVGSLSQAPNPNRQVQIPQSTSACSPLNGALKSPYGLVRDPQLETETMNTGVEIYGQSGEKILVAKAGRVVSIKEQAGWGRTVIVAHDGNYYSVYAHLGQVLVSLDQNLSACQALGTLSLDSRPYLSFHVYHNRQHLNPLRFVGSR